MSSYVPREVYRRTFMSRPSCLPQCRCTAVVSLLTKTAVDQTAVYSKADRLEDSLSDHRDLFSMFKQRSLPPPPYYEALALER